MGDSCLEAISTEMKLEELTPKAVEGGAIFTSARAFTPVGEIRQTETKHKHRTLERLGDYPERLCNPTSQRTLPPSIASPTFAPLGAQLLITSRSWSRQGCGSASLPIRAASGKPPGMGLLAGSQADAFSCPLLPLQNVLCDLVCLWNLAGTPDGCPILLGPRTTGGQSMEGQLS